MRSPRRLRHKLEKIPGNVGAVLDALMGVLPTSEDKVATEGPPKAYGKWGWVRRKAKARGAIRHRLEK